MPSDRFTLKELIEPKEMKIYWAFVHSCPLKKKIHSLVLVLKSTKKSVKLVRLFPETGLDSHGKVTYIKKENFQITGLGNNACNYQLEDFLTSSSDVIRKHALAYMEKQCPPTV